MMTMASSPTPRPADPTFEALARAYEEGRTAPFWELGIITVWFSLTFGMFDGVSILLYACVLYFVGQAFLDHRSSLRIAFQAWPLLLFPGFALLSVIWSPYAAAAFREGVLLLLTAVTIMVIAIRARPVQVLQCLMVAGMIAALLCLTTWQSIPLGGPFAHKNYLAIHILIAFLLCLRCVLSADDPGVLRLVALPFLILCPAIIVKSDAATSLVMMVVGGGGLILARLLLVDLGKVRDFKLVVIWSGLMTGLVLLSLAWLLPTDRITTQFYDLLGRDPTLTGRTALWDAARDISEDHLWFGVGLEGFWQYDVGSAQTLNENDYKPFGTKLGFHSAFWDVRVHLGLVGLGLFIWVIIWSVFRVTTRWMVDPSLNRSTFLLLAAVILGVSFTEGFLWGTFTVIVNIFYLAALADLGAGARRFLGLARVRVTETADMGDPT